jgi:hypothetical protein
MLHQYFIDRFGGVMVSMLSSNVIDCGFKTWSGQIKEYKFGIYSSTYHAALKSTSKDWLACNQDNLSD